MLPEDAPAPHYATMDVSLSGVFIPRGERIPDDLYESWRRRLEALGLDRQRHTPRLESRF